MSEQKTYKVVLIGESGVGKTCIINRYTNDKYDPNTVSSLTAQFIRKTIGLEGLAPVTLDIWDTAGQEKYRSLTKIFYKDAKAVILVYDITNKKSFEEMTNYWYEQIKQFGSKDAILAIAANKSDLYERMEVTNEEGQKFADEIGAFFTATSAQNDSGVNTLFENIARKIIDPDFDYAKEQKDKKKQFEEMKKKKKKEEQEENANKGVKLTTGKLNEKKKKNCC